MIRLRVNGVEQSFDGDPQMPLLWYLRDELGLMGPKFGCGVSLCGACTVNEGGKAIRSCVTVMSSAAGSEITTIEGSRARRPPSSPKGWIRLNVPQCGYCQSGQIMQAAALLKNNHMPNDADIDKAMAGNICRCGTYQKSAPRSRRRRRKAHERNRECQPTRVRQRDILNRRVGAAVRRLSPKSSGPQPPRPARAPRMRCCRPNVFVAIQSDETVSIVAARSEMGTGISTSLPLVLADELDADWTKVKIQQADGTSATATRTPTAHTRCVASST